MVKIQTDFIISRVIPNFTILSEKFYFTILFLFDFILIKFKLDLLFIFCITIGSPYGIFAIWSIFYKNNWIFDDSNSLFSSKF